MYFYQPTLLGARRQHVFFRHQESTIWCTTGFTSRTTCFGRPHRQPRHRLTTTRATYNGLLRHINEFPQRRYPNHDGPLFYFVIVKTEPFKSPLRRHHLRFKYTDIEHTSSCRASRSSSKPQSSSRHRPSRASTSPKPSSFCSSSRTATSTTTRTRGASATTSRCTRRRGGTPRTTTSRSSST